MVAGLPSDVPNVVTCVKTVFAFIALKMSTCGVRTIDRRVRIVFATLKSSCVTRGIQAAPGGSSSTFTCVCVNAGTMLRLT